MGWKDAIKTFYRNNLGGFGLGLFGSGYTAMMVIVGDSPHIMIIVLMRVNHFIYNIYTIYTHCSLLFTETLAGQGQGGSGLHYD
jgi:hypothetical protein